MCLIIIGVMIKSVFLTGLSLRRDSLGGSVARARAANESMIRLIHSIWTALNIASLRTMAETKVVMTATMLTVS